MTSIVNATYERDVKKQTITQHYWYFHVFIFSVCFCCRCRCPARDEEEKHCSGERAEYGFVGSEWRCYYYWQRELEQNIDFLQRELYGANIIYTHNSTCVSFVNALVSISLLILGK